MKATLLNLEQLFRSQCRAHSERRKKNPLQRSLTSVPPNSQLVSPKVTVETVSDITIDIVNLKGFSIFGSRFTSVMLTLLCPDCG